MKLVLSALIVSICAFSYANADGAAIVAAARAQIGTPYSYAGGNQNGKTIGIESGAHTVGFDCSGLAQYSVYQGTHKILARTAATQYADSHCHHVPFAQRFPGDLVFFNDGGSIHHVAIISGPNTQIHAPQTGDHVREAPIQIKGRMAMVQRCA